MKSLTKKIQWTSKSVMPFAAFGVRQNNSQGENMELLKGAKDFARTPLGIIALFISLIYGFASLLLNSSAEKLTVAERLSLIAFIVVFPIMVFDCLLQKLELEIKQLKLTRRYTRNNGVRSLIYGVL